VLYVLFLQAEDGIRYRNVTGVQTCALPISPDALPSKSCTAFVFVPGENSSGLTPEIAPVRSRVSCVPYPTTTSSSPSTLCCCRRSEERRVGKECKYRK